MTTTEKLANECLKCLHATKGEARLRRLLARCDAPPKPPSRRKLAREAALVRRCYREAGLAVPECERFWLC